MAKQLNLLVTGLSGVVGQALKPVLEERYNVSALSRRGVDGLPDERVFKANIADFDSLQPAFEGVATAEAGCGVPYLCDAHAHLECRVLGESQWSDHVIVCGEVLAGSHGDLEESPVTHTRKNGLSY